MMGAIKKYSFVVVISTVTIASLSCQGSGDSSELIAQHKQLAGELRDTQLFQAAVEEYQKILAFESIDTRTRANINYLIARIYFENIKNYGQAAAYYVRARSLHPEASFVNEASKNLIASLEKTGNVIDARRELGAATDIDGSSRKQGEVMVAKIGDDPIWLLEIDRQIQALPFEVQKQLVQPAAKTEFVRQYVGYELMYRAAVRENYGDDPEILRKLDRLRKELLIDRYLVDRVMPEIRIDTADVRNFYEANRAARYNSAPYDSVKAQVFIDYQGQKAEKAFSDYIAEMAKKEKVEVYENNIR